MLRGKLDLAQAEAVGDLIDARTQAMRRAAVAQLDGGLSRRVAELRERVLDVEALVAYDIDFPDEDDGPVPRARMLAAAEGARDSVAALLHTVPAGAIVRDGALVVIAGPPNAGKSSLFNALAGEARAIVTEVPGTTRDALEVLLEVPGAAWPLRLVDTAGLRETVDQIERAGIELSERWVARAHVVLACGETADDVDATVARVRPLTTAPLIEVRTKSDLASAPQGGAPRTQDATSSTPPPNRSDADRTTTSPIAVSATTGEGLHALVAAILDALSARYDAPSIDTPLVTRERHQRALSEAHAELAQFVEAFAVDALPAPVAAVHLRAAVHALDEIIGAIDVEDVLGRLFSTFCVGK